MTTFRAVPVLRIFDLDKAKEFYVGYLGFKVDWASFRVQSADVHADLAW